MVERQMQSPTRRTIVQDAVSSPDEIALAQAQTTGTTQASQRSLQSAATNVAAQSASTPAQQAVEEEKQSNERLADYFAIVGLPDELKPLDAGYDQIYTIEKVEIVIMERLEVSEIKKQLHQQRAKKSQVTNGVDISQQMMEELLLKQEQLEAQMLQPYEVPRHDLDREKWIDLDGTKNFFLHLTYGHNNPITDINFYYIAQKHEHKLAVPAKENMQLVPVRRHDGHGADVKYHTSFQQGSTEERNALVFHGIYDMKHYLDRQELSNFPKTGLSSPSSTNKALCMAIKRQKKLEQPIYDVTVIQGEGDKKLKTYQLQEGIKIVTYRLGLKKDRLLSFMKVDLLKTRFTPKILDRYPPEDRIDEPLADISHFCFPTGIQLKKGHLTPQSFHFILTGGEGSRQYGTVLIFDEQCPRGLKRKLKHAKYEDYNSIWTQKAICILSHYSFFDSFKQVLNKLYQVHLSQNMHIPIERFVLNIMDEVPLPDLGNTMVAYEENINFYRPVDQYPPYTDTAGIQNLFKALDVAGVIELFAQLALERKILLVSQHKTLLTQVAVALCSFIYPLSWNHTLIPILPISMINVIDAPFPFIIGVQAQILNEAINNQVIEMPQHVTIVNLDGPDINTVESSVASSKFPNREFKVLKEKLMKATNCVEERPHGDLEMIDDAFMRILIDPEEDNQIDAIGVRDAFLEFMSRIMENYKKYIKDPGMTSGQQVNDHAGSKDFFNYDKFRADKDASRPQTFIHKLTQTSNFGYFIESRSLGRSVNDEQIIYFDRIARMKRTSKKPTLLEPFEPKKVIRAEAPSEIDLVEEAKYMYEVFPVNLDRSLYYKPRKLNYHREDTMRSVHKQVLTKEQIKAMNEADWSRYMAEVIYSMWFHVFAATLPMYAPHASELIFFARQLLQYTTKKLHPLQEVEIVYRRLFEACGSCQQQEQVRQLYTEMQSLRHIDPDKITFGTYYQSLLLCQRDPSEPTVQSDRKQQYIPTDEIDAIERRRSFEEAKEYQESQASQVMEDQNNTAFRRGSNTGNDPFADDIFDKEEIASASDHMVQPQDRVIKLSQVLEGSLYIELQKECQHCEKPLREEELFSLFTQDQSDYTVKCPFCYQCFVPKFTVQSEYKTPWVNGREGLSMHLLPPCTLYKEFINTLAKKGDSVLTSEVFMTDHSVVFWNLLIYFRIMKLPIFFLDQDYSAKHARVQVSWIKKYLPSKVLMTSSTSKQNNRSSFGSKTRLDKDGLQKLERQQEKSPARNNSITRLAQGISSGIGNFLKRSSSKGPKSRTSEGAPPTGKNQNSSSKMNLATVGASTDTTTTLTGYGMGMTPSSALKSSNMPTQLSDMKSAFKKAGSVRSGGPGSIIGSTTSDIERLERLMRQAIHAKKSVVRMFGKNLDEFRREMVYAKEIINSDLLSQDIPDSMIRHAENFNMSGRSNDPFKRVVSQRFSIENINVQEPEARSSNASNNRPNAPMQTQLNKFQKAQSFPPKPPSGLLSINEDQQTFVRNNTSGSMILPQSNEQPLIPSANQQENGDQSPPFENRQPLDPNYQPEISPLANYAVMERSRSEQQPESKGTYDDEPNDMMEDDPTGGFDRN